MATKYRATKQQQKVKEKINPVNTKVTENKQPKGIGKLLNFFRLTPLDNGRIMPTEPVRNKQGKETGKYKPIDMPTTIEQAYQYFVQNMNTGVYRTNEARFTRYKDCRYMVEVEPLMNTAVQIYVSEAYMIEDGKRPITIKAKDSKVEKLFYEWIDSIGLTENVIKDIIYNLVVYGDAFWVNQIDLENNGGITGITCLDPFIVKNRIEFNVGMVNQQKQWNQSFLNITNTYGSLKQIFDTISKKGEEDFSQFYQSYLFGYELGINAEEADSHEQVFGVPPWAITHCRLFSTEKAFFPFGKPMLFNALASFKSYKTTEMLIDMLRVASFPREVINIKGNENMDTFARQQRVDETRQFLTNITPATNKQDGLAVGERIYTMEDLFEYDLIDPDIDMDKLGDLENKKSSMVMGTGIPDAYIIPSEGAGDLGGENAESLYYLSKIFQRRCNILRGAFMEGLTETFRMHLLLTDKFDKDKTEFELSMPTPVAEYNDDKVSHDSDMLDFATNILSNLGQMVGLERGDKLPDEVIRDVLKMYMPIDSSKIDKWVKLLTKVEEENKEEEQSKEEIEKEPAPLIVPTGNNSAKKEKISEQKLQEKINKLKEAIKKDDNMLRTAYFESKKKTGNIEGVLGNRVYYNNTYRLEAHYENSVLFMLDRQLQTQKVQKLEEKLEYSKKTNATEDLL